MSCGENIEFSQPTAVEVWRYKLNLITLSFHLMGNYFCS